MNERIIYENDDGGISIIIPTESVELALKDVPAGKEYKIVDVSSIPTDRTFRGAWEWQEPVVEPEQEVTE